MREKMLNDLLEKNNTLHAAAPLDLEAFQATVKSIREMTDSEVLARYVKLPPGTAVVNWERLQKEYVPTHTPCDCKVQWEHHLSPAVANLQGWTAEEDQRLIALASKYHEHNWGAIAQELAVCVWFSVVVMLMLKASLLCEQTGRQAFECCARFQRSLNHKLLKKFVPIFFFFISLCVFVMLFLNTDNGLWEMMKSCVQQCNFMESRTGS